MRLEMRRCPIPYAVLLPAAVCIVSPLKVAASDDTTDATKPVKAIADHVLQVTTARGKGTLPLYLSVDGKATDLTRPHPEVVRALIVFHGKLRNADEYNDSGLEAIKRAGEAGKGTLLITPQFLGQVDIDMYRLPQSVLRWAPEAWMGGQDATNSPVSSFDAVDTILVQLADRKLFPT